MQGQKQTEVPEFKIIIKDVEASILILISYKYRRRKKQMEIWKVFSIRDKDALNQTVKSVTYGDT